MADYLLPVMGPVPEGFDYVALTQAVYLELRSDEAVADLTLPPTAAWGIPVTILRPVFQLIENDAHVSDCYTHLERNSGEWRSIVKYTLQEYTNCPLLIEQRFCHEITHGLRCSIIQSTINNDPEARNKYVFNTPPMATKKRKFRSSNRLFMHNPGHSFHSGYWIEHRMYGGVALGLTGKYFTDKDDRAGTLVDLAGGVLYFRAIRTSSYVNYDADLYVKTTGYMYDTVNNVFQENETSIFHCGDRITRTGENLKKRAPC